MLSQVAWEEIIRLLGLRERTKGIGDGKIEGHPYTVVQRGNEISIVLPDYEPREKCLEMVKKILLRIAQKSTIEVATVGHASSHCNYCLQPTPLPYQCSRCEGWYCQEHRLPEKHNCPEEKRKTERIIRRIKPKREEKKKVVVAEIPCG
jgi:predicted nucleic acid binding AN1-type Zn finger protein